VGTPDPEPAPDLRILQANERTLLAWMRSGLALMAFGFVVARLAVWLRLEHPERGDGAISAWHGIAAIALGVACEIAGVLRFVRARRAIVEGKPIVPGPLGPVLLTGAVAAFGLAAIIYLLAGSAS
jgi:putative membrane protein